MTNGLKKWFLYIVDIPQIVDITIHEQDIVNLCFCGITWLGLFFKIKAFSGKVT